MILKAKDLRNETLQELVRKLEDIRHKYMELRFHHASGTLKNPLELKNKRRDIARLLTVIHGKNNE